MIKTDEFGTVTVGGMIDSLFAEYGAAGRAIARGAISEGYDERVLRVVFEAVSAWLWKYWKRRKSNEDSQGNRMEQGG